MIKWFLKKISCKSSCVYNIDHHEHDYIKMLKNMYDLKNKDVECIGNILQKRVKKEVVDFVEEWIDDEEEEEE